MVPLPYTVTRRQRETRDVVTLTLQPQGGEASGFRPGQFNMLYVFGVGEVPISISGDPSQPGRVVHTVRDVGAVTRALAGLRRGQTVGVRGALGTPWPVEEARGHDVVIMAGGLGLAPLRPAIYYLLRHREQFGRIALLCGARTPADVLFNRELERWGRHQGLDVLVTVDRADPSWTGEVGLVTHLLGRVTVRPEETMALVCGPEVMMRFSALELAKLGIGADRIYVSMERSMKCGVGFCGHCQFGPEFICKDGPVFRYDRVRDLMAVREV